MATSKKGPLLRNRTRIDQLVYDESYSPVTIPPGKTIRGEWYRKYAGKNGPLALVSKKVEEESDEVKTEDDDRKGSAEGKDKK